MTMIPKAHTKHIPKALQIGSVYTAATITVACTLNPVSVEDGVPSAAGFFSLSLQLVHNLAELHVDLHHRCVACSEFAMQAIKATL